MAKSEQLIEEFHRGTDRPSRDSKHVLEGLPPATNPVHLHMRVVELYGQLHEVLFSHVRGLGLPTTDVEDVVNEAFLRLIHHLSDGRPEDNLRAWLFQVTHNLAMDVHRCNKRFIQETEIADRPSASSHKSLHGAPSPEEILISKESLERLSVAVTELSIQQQRCVSLRSQGLPYREIALRLGVSVQRVGKLIERSVTRLSTVL